MSSSLSRRYFPARQLLVRGQPSAILRSVTEVFQATGFRLATVVDESTLELEIGSAAREFWLGGEIVSYFLTGRARALVMHGFAVAHVSPSEAADSGHPETRLTVSSVRGLETPAAVVEVIDECLAFFARSGLLLHADELISGADLPADSLCSPAGYGAWRRRRRRA